MAYPPLIKCEIRFTSLHCSQDGEIGKAEPYLWVAFFQVDGMQNRLAIDLTPNNENRLIGKFQTQENESEHVIVRPPANWTSKSRNGHGNIGSGIKGGRTRGLKDIKVNGSNPFSWYFGDLIPIPLYCLSSDGTEYKSDTNAPGIIGCVGILLEEDNTPDNAVLAGYRALLEGLKDGLNKTIAEYEFDFTAYVEAVLSGETPEISISDESISTLKSDIAQRIENAIKDKIKKDASLWEKIKVVTDADDVLGTGVWYWTTAELQESPTVKSFESEVWHPFHLNPSPIGPRYIHLGIWQLFGEVKAKKFNCFIATAAYGSYLDSHVEVLREFRDQYLVTNPVGSALVSLYYKLSPPVADFIDEHPALKPIVRVGLLPAVAIVRWLLARHRLRKWR